VRFYTTGCFQRPVGEQWGISMSQTSISRCIHKVTNAINDLIFRQWVQFPITPESRHLARMQFQNAHQPFEWIIGAIDCTHVAILLPKIMKKLILIIMDTIHCNAYGEYSNHRFVQRI